MVNITLFTGYVSYMISVIVLGFAVVGFLWADLSLYASFDQWRKKRSRRKRDAAYILDIKRRLEEVRLAEEKKKEEARLAEEKKKEEQQWKSYNRVSGKIKKISGRIDDGYNKDGVYGEYVYLIVHIEYNQNIYVIKHKVYKEDDPIGFTTLGNILHGGQEVYSSVQFPFTSNLRENKNDDTIPVKYLDYN